MMTWHDDTWQVSVLKLSDIDILRHRFTADIFVEASWVDHSVGLQRGIEIDPVDCTEKQASTKEEYQAQAMKRAAMLHKLMKSDMMREKVRLTPPPAATPSAMH